MRSAARVAEMARFAFRKCVLSARYMYVFFPHRRQTLLVGCDSSRPTCDAVAALPGGLMDI